MFAMCQLRKFFFIIILHALQECEATQTNDLILSLIERLGIRKCVVVVNGLFSKPIFFAKDFKYFARKKIHTSFVDSSRIVEDVFSNVESYDRRTLVVFQTMEFVYFLETRSTRPVRSFNLTFRLEEAEKWKWEPCIFQFRHWGTDGLSLCKWLAFDNASRFLTQRIRRNAPLPFDTDFLIAVPSAISDHYEINEIYNLVDWSMILNFGNWTNTSTSFSPLETYQRRKNFWGIPVEYGHYLEDEYRVRTFGAVGREVLKEEPVQKPDSNCASPSTFKL